MECVCVGGGGGEVGGGGWVEDVTNRPRML